MMNTRFFRLLRDVAHAGFLFHFAFCSDVEAVELSAAPLPQPRWGRIVQQTNGTGTILLEVHSWPADGKLSLPTPFPNITAAHLLDGRKHQSLKWVFNADATQLNLEIPMQAPMRFPATILLESAGNSGQFAEGRIVFSALDARVLGDHAKLESQPGHYRIGFWTDANDSVSWNFKPTRWGRYNVEFAFSADGGSDTELQFDIADQIFTVIRPSTASWYRYQTLALGPVYLAKSELFTLRVSCRRMTGAAVMNLKAVTLRPASEGKPITQDASGAIILHARDAITHSVMMRYEPATNKNCLGYWTHPSDWAEWEFTVTQPGTFEVEVWQGCGQGNGGSDVAVAVDDQKLPFTVSETGHFQNFVPRRIGRATLVAPGVHAVSVRPLHKRAAAVMDIREVKLIPVDPNAKTIRGCP